jgi:hypothetical protein
MFRIVSGRVATVAVAACAVSAPALFALLAPGHTASTEGDAAGDATRARIEELANQRPAPALDANKFISLPLVQKKQLTHDTARYTFALPRENDELGLTVASCLVVKADLDGSSQRKYCGSTLLTGALALMGKPLKYGRGARCVAARLLPHSWQKAANGTS